MKTKLILTLLIIATCSAIGRASTHDEQSVKAYSVCTETTKKGVLLEEFTGISCGYCPQGHAIAESLRKASPLVYVVAIHAGSYSTPGLDQPDFRTDEGAELADWFSTESFGYPCGMVNRHDFNASGSPVCSRSVWKERTKECTGEEAPLNLLATASYEGASQLLTIHVEGYFTASEQADDQELNVVWTQSDILGPQNGGLLGDEYPHRHVLRGYVTPLWGDTLASPRQGEYFSRDYALELPESIRDVEVKPEDIDIVAFVTNGRQDVLNVTGCKPAYANYDKPLGGELSDPLLPIGNYWGCRFFEVTLKNTSDKEMTEATFDIDVNGEAQTVAWTGRIGSFASEEITLRRDYETEEGGQNSYSITLCTVNGEPVEASTIGGTFASPRQATPDVTLELKTNSEADENTFCIKDADGQTVVEFGPYPAGQVTQTTESTLLEANRIYYIEVTDKWGDGIYSPAGYYTARSSDGSLIEQVFDISDFGVRTVFRTSKSASGIEGITDETDSDAQVTVYRMDGTRAYSGPRKDMRLPAGTYIIYDNASRTASKKTISK